MARRHRIDFNKPLAGPDSKVVYHCYASHGKGFAKNPPWGSKIRVLCFNRTTREVKWADGWFSKNTVEYQCDEMRGVSGWVRLGWTMADGSLPLGELDLVDPLMANLERTFPVIDCRDIAPSIMPEGTWKSFRGKDS